MSEPRLTALAITMRCDACGTVISAEFDRDEASVEHALALVREGAKCVCATTEVIEAEIALASHPQQNPTND